MLRLRVCAAHMDGFLAQNSMKEGSIFCQIFLRRWLILLKLAKRLKIGSFLPKFNTKVDEMAIFGN